MSRKTKSYITRLGTAVPEYKISQEDAAAFMAKTVAREADMIRKIKVLYRATRIRERYSVLGDYLSPDDFTFFPNSPDLSPFPTTADRMAKYREEAAPLGMQAVKKALPQEELTSITHLITVSCTGMYAPGLDIDLVNGLQLSGNVQRTCINFMGCYAAFNALKVADSIVGADSEAKVLIVSVELCSLHFQMETDRDQLLANSLFADGAAAVLVEGKPRSGWNLSLDAFRCQLIPQGASDMAWNIKDTGFEMRLSAYVPDLLAGVANEAVQALLTDLPLKGGGIDLYAIHPGGRKVLEALEKALNLPREKNAAAYQVLASYGNMSSATVLFVLEETLANLTPDQDRSRLLSMAFGPGLTLESALMQVVHA